MKISKDILNSKYILYNGKIYKNLKEIATDTEGVIYGKRFFSRVKRMPIDEIDGYANSKSELKRIRSKMEEEAKRLVNMQEKQEIIKYFLNKNKERK